jgi:hypothetical protein
MLVVRGKLRYAQYAVCLNISTFIVMLDRPGLPLISREEVKKYVIFGSMDKKN